MAKYLEFFNGHKMPMVGLGLWEARDPAELEIAINEALKAGYRHFDTAYVYQNEEVLGKVLKEWLDAGKVKREDLFVVTKLPPIGMRPAHVPYFLEKSLKNLQLDYVDLYLIHMPVGFHYVSDTDLYPMKDGKLFLDLETNLEAIWKSLEEQVDKKLTRSIGLSNFAPSQIERIVKVARIQPANLQIEVSATVQQRETIELCKKLNITVCAYSPLGSPGRKAYFERRGMTYDAPPLMEDPVVTGIAKNKNRTPAQILLRFLIQLNLVVIPKSTNPDRLKKNFELYDFELNAEDMKLLKGLDTGKSNLVSLFQSMGFGDHPEYKLA